MWCFYPLAGYQADLWTYSIDDIVHDQVNGQSQRSVAYPETDDAANGVVHLHDVCYEHRRTNAFPDAYLSVNWKDSYLRHATLYVLLPLDLCRPTLSRTMALTRSIFSSSHGSDSTFEARVCQHGSRSIPFHAQLPTFHHADRDGRTAHEQYHGHRPMFDGIRGKAKSPSSRPAQRLYSSPFACCFYF